MYSSPQGVEPSLGWWVSLTGIGIDCNPPLPWLVECGGGGTGRSRLSTQTFADASTYG